MEDKQTVMWKSVFVCMMVVLVRVEIHTLKVDGPLHVDA